jgi:16S rRNA G1207 methylase RsmC
MSPATSDQERDNSLTPVPGDKGKKRQTSLERDILEYEEQQAKEKQEVEERAAAMEADLTPHERAHLVAANHEMARQMQELATEWTRDIEEAQKNIERVENYARKSQWVLPHPITWSKWPTSFATEFHRMMTIFRMLHATPRMRARRRRRRKRKWG